jgi:hypothetical protein
MTGRLTAAIARALREPEEQVHFHLGPDARPFVCERRHCGSPGL